MNCSHARADLPALLYGDMKPEEAAGLTEHLASCPDCRGEHAALKQVRSLLDAVPVPDVALDLPRLYRGVAERQAMRLRRWRRGAVLALVAAAAVVLLAVGVNLHVQMDANQATLRWGSPPPDPVPTPPAPQTPSPVVTRVEYRSLPEIEDQLRILSELVQMLANDLETRDQRQQAELARLQVRLQNLQRLAAEHWTATERDIEGIYTLQLSQKQKGTSP
jgi:Putative zinc-finger